MEGLNLPPLRLTVVRGILRRSLRLHAVLMRLLEDHILDQLLRYGKLLGDSAVGSVVDTCHDADTLRGEQHATRGDVLRTQVLRLVGADTGESHLEDADALQFHLLSHLEEVLHGSTQFIEDGYYVTSLHRCLCLDEVCQLLRSYEGLVIDGACEVLALGH